MDDDTNGFSDIFPHEVDLSPEVVSVTRANANPTAVANVDFIVTFSEPVTGVTADDFTLTMTGTIQGAAVGGVSGSGDSYTVTVTTGSGLSDIRLGMPHPTRCPSRHRKSEYAISITIWKIGLRLASLIGKADHSRQFAINSEA
jgi:hypothetical protein